MRKIAEQGSLAHVEGIPEEIRRVFVCAHDVSPQWHVRMQAAFQEHTDNAVSKTVNFPNSATKEDVAQVYRLAWQLGCKGTTIYRDGSRDEQVLNIGKVNGGGKEEPSGGCTECGAEYGHVLPRARPTVTTGFTEKVKIGCGNLYITVNYDEMGICEVFTNTGRAGGCPSQSEATARLVSVAIRSGVNPKELIQQLKGIRCPSCLRQPGVPVMSCPDAIAKALEKIIQVTENGSIPAAIPANPIPTPKGNLSPAEAKLAKFCPECGSRLEHEGGCVTCRSCGYSKCG